MCSFHLTFETGVTQVSRESSEGSSFLFFPQQQDDAGYVPAAKFSAAGAYGSFRKRLHHEKRMNFRAWNARTDRSRRVRNDTICCSEFFRGRSRERTLQFVAAARLHRLFVRARFRLINQLPKNDLRRVCSSARPPRVRLQQREPCLSSHL